MEPDQPNQDFGFSTRPRTQLAQALLDEGPLHGQILSVDEIPQQKLNGGFYQRDPACTYSPSEGGKYALFRWIQSQALK